MSRMNTVNDSVCRSSVNRKRSFSTMSVQQGDQLQSCSENQDNKEKELNELRNKFIYNNIERNPGTEDRGKLNLFIKLYYD